MASSMTRIKNWPVHSSTRQLARILVIVSSLLVVSCESRPALPDAVQNLIFKTLTGKQIALADVNGPLLVNFWATDCGICLKEMPELVELYRNYADSGFELVAVAMPYDAPNLVLQMAERERWPFPVALDVQGEALTSFASVKGTPTTFLLDEHGKLVKRYVGAIPMDDLQKQLISLLGLS